jgi:hypothetical protein
MSKATMAACRNLAKLTSGQRFFAKQQNLWYRAVRNDNNNDDWKVQMGFTETGLDHLGDVTAIQRIIIDNNNNSTQSNVNSGDDLLNVTWEGFTQTGADELYHTVWETMEGGTVIQSPVAGRVSSICQDDPNKIEVDDETVLAEISCMQDDLLEAAQDWIEQEDYEKSLREPGKFADSA